MNVNETLDNELEERDAQSESPKKPEYDMREDLKPRAEVTEDEIRFDESRPKKNSLYDYSKEAKAKAKTGKSRAPEMVDIVNDYLEDDK